MVIGINYADAKYRGGQIYNTCTAKKFGEFDKFIEYSPKDIDSDFARQYSHILTQPRGGGYWLWKPYVIWKTLRDAEDGDFVFYSDSGSYYAKSIRPLTNCMIDQNQDVMLFNQGFLEATWTKRDILAHFGVVGDARITETHHFIGGYQCYRKSDFSMEFVDSLLKHSSTGTLITDAKSTTGREDMRFKENRHDQSILGVFAKVRGIKPHRRPDTLIGNTMRDNMPSPYGKILITARHRNLPANAICGR